MLEVENYKMAASYSCSWSFLFLKVRLFVGKVVGSMFDPVVGCKAV